MLISWKGSVGFLVMVPCRYFLAYVQVFEVTLLKPCFFYVFPFTYIFLDSLLVFCPVLHCLPELLVVPSMSFLVLSTSYKLSETNVFIIYKGIYLRHFKF